MKITTTAARKKEYMYKQFKNVHDCIYKSISRYADYTPTPTLTKKGNI